MDYYTYYHKRRNKNNIVKLNNRKAFGPDRIRNEMLKHGVTILVRELYTLNKKMLTKQKIPEQWGDGETA